MRSIVLLVSISIGACGCGASGSADDAQVPAAGVRTTIDLRPVAFAGTDRAQLRAYLLAWRRSWWLLGRDLARGPDAVPAYSTSHDATWPRAQRYFGRAAAAYRADASRLLRMTPPSTMRPASDAYVGAVQRQATRFQRLADAFGGDDSRVVESADEALELSQLQFDMDGAQWEQAVIAACKATDIAVPTIVRREYISNGQRTG